ncbi:MAG: iron ABC transporter permease [Firmicutes bacterium HGW-Firmicutes-4]|jgi:iron(III) transport system permease protein|nr:MAG: iron ABC transporter permease [Firmicutes bacterium HGW-Firmicutes-4]
MKKSINDIKILKYVVYIFLLILLMPLLYIFKNTLTQNSNYLNLILDKGILLIYIQNTLQLILKVGLLASIIGFLGAYFITFYNFKNKWIINLLFILPLSIPVYVGAYTYTDIFHTFSVLETILKNEFTMNGVVFIYTAFLYPYVYLASRSYLKNNMAEYIEVSETLQISPLKTFFKVILPLSRPVIVSSSLFVIYESLSDFAVAEYYGVPTLSKAINDSWLLIAEKDTAFKLSLSLLFILFFIIYLERISRGKGKNNATIHKPNKLKKASKVQKKFIYAFYTLVISLGFLLPFKNIVEGAIKNREYFIKKDILSVSINTLTTTLITIFIIIVLAMFLTSMLKFFTAKNKRRISSISMLGYAIPSVVLGLGIYSFLVNIDNVIMPYLQYLGFTEYLFTGTRLALIIALTFKFLSIAYSQFEQSYEKIDKSIFESSYVLGKNATKTFFLVDFFFLLKSVRFVIILIFIDLIKDLTLTYSLRPFNFNTLSTEVYRYAGNEMLDVAAVPSIVIVMFSIISILILERMFKNAKGR